MRQEHIKVKKPPEKGNQKKKKGTTGRQTEDGTSVLQKKMERKRKHNTYATKKQ